MQSKGLQVETIAPYVVPPAYLVTAKSFLMDRYVPACEIIALPEKSVPAGELRFGRGPLEAPADTRGRLERLRKPRRTVPAPDGLVIDLRRNYPQNWSHFLNNHLPILFHIAEEVGVPPDQFVAILPSQTPSYIKAAAAFFGITIFETDDIVAGEGIIFDAQPWFGIRPMRSAWARQSPHVQQCLAQLDAQSEASPARVYLSRRDSRTIENGQEVEDFLTKRGFVTVYPEELPVEQQISLFRQAEAMVAIHGAGLAPLMYSHPGGRLKNLIEMLPCGLMSDVFRVMAEQAGCTWTGVRGQIKAGYIPRAYDFTKPMVEFSFDAFQVDIASLEHAFQLAKISDT